MNQATTTTRNSISAEQTIFPFVHPNISSVLECKIQPLSSQVPRTSVNSRVDHDCRKLEVEKKDGVSFLSSSNEDGVESLSISFPTNGTLKDLVHLAHECDFWIYGDSADPSSCSLWGAFSNDNSHLPVDSESVQTTKNHIFALELARFAVASPTCAMVSTLIALNRLESSIRYTTGYTTGKAPLLKNMLEELVSSVEEQEGSSSSSQNLAPLAMICKLLLLPHEGLNLRNLLWHGFVAELPRPWLSLVLVITELLDRETNTSPKSEGSPWTAAINVMNPRDYPEMKRLLEARQHERQQDHRLWVTLQESDWLPSAHLSVLRLVFDWLPPALDTTTSLQTRPPQSDIHRPATCCALLSILMEHGIRLQWCAANQRQDDIQARPSVFYVTLDGHGQRNIHDLLLHPQVTVETEKPSFSQQVEKRNSSFSKPSISKRETAPNALIAEEKIPGSILALLTDLFCSSCGGPNIRATVAHGMWDEALIDEWTTREDRGSFLRQEKEVEVCRSDIEHRLWDMVHLQLLAMESLSKQKDITYQPIFSFAAVTRRNLQRCQDALGDLAKLQEDSSVFAERRQDSVRQMTSSSPLLFSKYFSTATCTFGETPSELVPVIKAARRTLFPIDKTGGESRLRLILDWASGKRKTPLATPSTTGKPSRRSNKSWTSDDVFAEHQLNERLAKKGITRSLLKDVAEAAQNLSRAVEDALQRLENEPTAHKRKRKSWLRIIHSAPIGFGLYSFAFWVAILSLSVDLQTEEESGEPPPLDAKTMKKALERSRMMVSTVDTFMCSKVDRAIKSACEYTKGKAIKEVVKYLCSMGAASQEMKKCP